MAGSDYCYSHNPDVANARNRARSLGGQNLANRGRDRPESAQILSKDLPSKLEIKAELASIAKRVILGQVSAAAGSAATTALRVLLKEAPEDDPAAAGGDNPARSMSAAEIERAMLAELSTEVLEAELRRRLT